jgi:hypothetical protein
MAYKRTPDFITAFVEVKLDAVLLVNCFLISLSSTTRWHICPRLPMNVHTEAMHIVRVDASSFWGPQCFKSTYRHRSAIVPQVLACGERPYSCLQIVDPFRRKSRVFRSF